MKLKNKTKILLVLGIVFVAFLLFNTNNVQAAEITKSPYLVTNENGKVTITDNKNNTITQFDNLGIDDIKDIEDYAGYAPNLVVSQTTINKFNTKKDISYTYKQKLEENVTNITTVDGKTLDIETINGEKWLVYKGIAHYSADNLWNATEFFNDDISSVEWIEDIEYYENDKKDNKKCFSPMFLIKSENECYATPVGISYVNKRDMNYGCLGGMGGFGIDNGKYMFNPKFDNDIGHITARIPKNANLTQVYLKLGFKEYQGDKIVLEDNKGILYYEGKQNGFDSPDIGHLEGSFYIYKNKLSDLNLNKDCAGCTYFKHKFENDYTVIEMLDLNYMLDENAKEEIVTVNESTKNEQNIKNEIGINYYGNAQFDSVKIDKSDSIYNDIKNEIDKSTVNWSNHLYLNIIDIYRISGNYGGKLTLTFNVGEQYNGKYYHINHRVRYGEFERFEGIVENGKIEITVDSLSPFGILIADKKEETQTPSTNNNNKPAQETTKPSTDNNKPTQVVNKGEKDETPKTGTIDIIGYVVVATTIAGIGIVTLKKKLR